MGILVNIDNGGTFTDACASDGDRVAYAKSPTTPHDLTQCFVESMVRVSKELYGEEDLARLIGETDYLRYSTTSGTNAIVERKGQPVALIVEAGEEEQVYGVTAQFGSSNLWTSMVPQQPIGIKVDASGQIDTDELLTVVAQILQDSGQRIVISLRTEEAEYAVKEVLLERYPRHLLGAVPFLISYEADKDLDHARRTMTAVLNSYLHAGMEHFLYGAENVCKQNNLAHPLLIYRNDGDSARVAKTTAIKTWGSGPRGGLEGTMAYAAHYGVKTLVAMDIGGTTTDLSLVRDNTVKLRSHGSVEAATTSLSLPAMYNFGLGGSSIITVSDGEIEIGPESVGAAPGPACFGRGGKEVTITDALLLAGVIDGESYLGGELKLDKQRAVDAIEANISAPLGLELDDSVAAVVKAFQVRSATHLQEVIDAAGGDPAETALMAYGGGGAMIATGIAAEVGIKQIIVPQLAAVFSAFGIGFSNLAHEYRAPLVAGDVSGMDVLQAEMLDRAQRDMFGEGVDQNACTFEFSLQYDADGEVARSELSDARLQELSAVDNLALRLKATYPLPSATIEADVKSSNTAPKKSGSSQINHGSGSPENLPVYSMKSLRAGSTLQGPALIRDAYLTCFVQTGWDLRVSGNNDLILEEVSA